MTSPFARVMPLVKPDLLVPKTAQRRERVSSEPLRLLSLVLAFSWVRSDISVLSLTVHSAWIAGVLQITAGAIMMGQGCGSSDDESNYGGQSDYNYNAANIVNNNQYGGTGRSDNSRKQFV